MDCDEDRGPDDEETSDAGDDDAEEADDAAADDDNNAIDDGADDDLTTMPLLDPVDVPVEPVEEDVAAAPDDDVDSELSVVGQAVPTSTATSTPHPTARFFCVITPPLDLVLLGAGHSRKKPTAVHSFLLF